MQWCDALLTVENQMIYLTAMMYIYIDTCAFKEWNFTTLLLTSFPGLCSYLFCYHGDT